MSERPKAGALVRVIRDGKPIQLASKRTAAGLPCCVVCGCLIPASYRRWRVRDGRATYFCKDAHAIDFAVTCAEGIYPGAVDDGR